MIFNNEEEPSGRGHDRMVVLVGILTTCAYHHSTLWVRTPFMARCTRYNILW